jgi:hypothetical protein
MKPVPASLIAMVAGWAVSLAGLAIEQFATTGRTADVGVSAFWVGLFSLIGWAVGVWPLVVRFGRYKLISGLKWSWLGWSLGGMVIFLVLLMPIMGRSAFEILWYPALMGGIAGPVFSLLIRLRGQRNA